MSERSFFHTPISDLEFEDIKLLADNKIPESQILDYKRDNYKDSGELAKDISAFANTNGGYLILGIVEERKGNKSTGVPEALAGIEKEPDLKKRLCDRIINSISPQPNITFSNLIPVPNEENRALLVIHVPKSFDGLHMVMVRGKYQSRYYKRYHDQNIPMDEHEVRTRYEVIGRGEEYLNNKIREMALETIYMTGTGNLARLSITIATKSQQGNFTDRQIVNDVIDERRVNHPYPLMRSGFAARRKINYFEKLTDKINPEQIIRFYFDGTISYASRFCISYNRENGHLIFPHRVYYELYHLFSIIQNYYLLYCHMGILRYRIEMSNTDGYCLELADSRWRFDPIEGNCEQFSGHTGLNTISEDKILIGKELVTKLFYGCNIDEARGCWKTDGTPIVDY